MAPGDIALNELEAGEVPVKEEDDEDFNMAMLDKIEQHMKEEGEVHIKTEGGEAADETIATSSKRELERHQNRGSIGIKRSGSTTIDYGRFRKDGRLSMASTLATSRT